LSQIDICLIGENKRGKVISVLGIHVFVNTVEIVDGFDDI
jgi:hypothetical protein